MELEAPGVKKMTRSQAIEALEQLLLDLHEHSEIYDCNRIMGLQDFLRSGKDWAEDDPACVCGVAKSEHLLCGCESFERRSQ